MSQTFALTPDQWLRRFVVVTVILVSSIIAVVVIFSTILLPIVSPLKPPPALENWGGIIIGFYFGTFVGMLKDWLGGTSEGDDGPNGNDTDPDTLLSASQGVVAENEEKQTSAGPDRNANSPSQNVGIPSDTQKQED